MDEFRNYRGHMILAHATGPDVGPWVSNYSVLAVNEHSELYSVLHGVVTGTFSSIEIATTVATAQARQRTDDFLAKRERYAANVLGQRFVAHINDIRNV